MLELLALYGLPFLLLVDNVLQWAIIVGTHLVIDRFRLAGLWVSFWGIGATGTLPSALGARVDDAPAWLAVWLLILVDNTLHLAINAATLRLL